MEKSNFSSTIEKLYLGIFFVPLIFNPWGYIPFEIPKVAWLICWVTAALSVFGVQIARQKAEFIWNKKILIYIGLWLLSLCISTIFSIAPLESFWGTYERMQGLLIWVFYLLHFFICISIFRKKKLQSIFLNIVEIVGTIVAIHALLQFSGYDFVRLPVDEVFEGRSYATVGQPTMLGQWLIFPLFVAGLSLLKNWKNEQRWKHMFMLGCISAGLLTTVNRATYLAVGITLIFALCTKYWAKISTKKKALMMSVGITLISLVFMSGSHRSFLSRISIWSHSVPMIAINPLTGIGLEAYYQEFQKQVSPELFQTEGLYTIPDRAHFELLHVTIEQGIFGGLLYLFPFLYGVYIYIKRKKNDQTSMVILALTASIISVQFSFMFSAQIIFHFAFWALVVQEVFPLQKIKIGIKNVLVRAAIIIAVLILSIMTIWHAATSVFSDMKLREALTLIETDLPTTKMAFDNAIKLNENRARPLNLAINALARPDILAEDQLLKENLNNYLKSFGKITNESFEFLTTKARINLANGDYEGAKNSLQAALKKAPNSALVYQTFAENAYFTGRYQEAIEYFDQLWALAPQYIWDPSDDKARIFYKSNPLFVIAIQEYEDAKVRLLQLNN